MTTPSETRAGKLSLDASIIKEASEVLEAVGASGVVLPDNWRWPLTDELAGIALEALAASEPVEAVGEVANTDGRGLRIDWVSGWPQVGTKLYTHPAPEQPGKGDVSEGEMRAAASRLTASDETNRTADSFIAAYQTQQPPDPAEGDAAERCESGDPECGPVEFHDSEGVPLCRVCWDGLLLDNATCSEWTPERIAFIAERVRASGDEEAANLIELLNAAGVEAEQEVINASTPPTAAVSVDAADLLFVGFDKNSEHRLFRMRETAEHHCIGEIKTYAALDPQVKR